MSERTGTGVVRRLAAHRLALGNPLQLLLLLCSFAFAGYVGVRLFADRWFDVALWIVGAALLHDLVLLPLYAMADRAVLRGLGAAGRRAWAGYVRVPAALALLLLLVWFPLIARRNERRYALTTGHSADAFLGHWLLITAGLFGGSALLLAFRVLRDTKRRPPASH
nr:hypothetical protein [Streptomyces sp. SID5785]